MPETTHIMPMRSFVRRTPPARVWVLQEEASELVNKRAIQKIIIMIKGIDEWEEQGRNEADRQHTVG
jgi:hypothetical protein